MRANNNICSLLLTVLLVDVPMHLHQQLTSSKNTIKSKKEDSIKKIKGITNQDSY
ncbi:hypothetical protein LINPERHAP1_LOCUS26386, partial [Linum perenne]